MALLTLIHIGSDRVRINKEICISYLLKVMIQQITRDICTQPQLHFT